MIQLTFCLRRHAHLTVDAFQRYWRETHGPLVQSLAPALGIRRYVQVHALDHPMNAFLRQGRNAPEPFDGVAELWWDSLDDLLAATATVAGRDAARRLLEDEQAFIDHARSPLWISDVHPIVDS